MASERRMRAVAVLAAAAAGALTAAVSPRAAGAERATPVVLTGTAAPGYSTAAPLATLGHPTLADDGRVLFRGAVVQGGGITASNDTGLWTASPGGLSAVAVEGQPVAGLGAGTVVGDFQLYVAGPLYQTFDSGGRVAFVGRTVNPADSSSLGVFSAMLRSPGGQVDGLARAGGPKPDSPGNWATTGGFGFHINPGGRYVLRDNTSLYTGTSTANPTLVARIGQVVAGRTIESVQSGAITRGGRVLFHANADPTVTDERYVSFAATPPTTMGPPAVTRLLSPGDPAPGVTPATTVLRAVQAHANAAGEFLVAASLSSGPAGSGLWKGNLSTPGTFTKVFAAGEAAPGLPGVTFSGVYARGLSDSGRIFVTADLAGSSIGNSNRTSLWVAHPGEGLKLLARQGDLVNLPGVAPTARWGGLTTNIATNANDQAVFGSIGTHALFGYDPSLGIVPLVKAGDALEVSPGVTRIVQSLTIPGDDFVVLGGNTNEGRAVALNDLGEVVYRAVFTDNSQGIFRTRVPVAGDATFDGVVDFEDFRVLYANIGKAGSRGEGDFNADGKVTFSDYQILERNFGRHPPGVAGPGPGDWDSLEAARALVPEPGAGAVVAVALLAGLMRRRRARSCAQRPAR